MTNLLSDEKNTRKQIDAIFPEIDKLNPEGIKQTEIAKQAFGHNNDAEVIFDRILYMYKQIKEGNLDNLNNSILNQIYNFLTGVREYFKSIQGLNLKNHSLTQIADHIISKGKSMYDQYFDMNRGSNAFLLPIISYIKKQPAFNEVEQQLNETKKTVGNVIKELGDSKKEASGILEKIRELAAGTSVAKHAVHFQTASSEHDEIAKNWLWATIVLGLATIAWGIFSDLILNKFMPLSKPPETIEIMHLIASKVIILSILYYGVVWSGRNYSAHRHNFVVNKHRQNALNSFETFVSSSSADNATKNAVLLEATHSIFSLRSSGYLRKDSDLESPSKVVEIMKDLNPVQK